VTTVDILKDGDICPVCGFGRMAESSQKDADGQSIYLSCPECEAVQLCYLPLPHQQAFHADPAKIKMFAGGYG
jgi:rubredoxin